jgi:hypothetical protein
MAEDNIDPSKTIFACLGVRKTTAHINNKTKLVKINQKLPISNIVPNKETPALEEKRAERRETMTTPSPDINNQDFGKTILPSTNLAIAQKTIEAASPTTRSNPFDVSTGILVKGKQKRGNKIITINKDKNENLSKMFELIVYILYYRLFEKYNLNIIQQC